MIFSYQILFEVLFSLIDLQFQQSKHFSITLSWDLFWDLDLLFLKINYLESLPFIFLTFSLIIISKALALETETSVTITFLILSSLSQLLCERATDLYLLTSVINISFHKFILQYLI